MQVEQWAKCLRLQFFCDVRALALINDNNNNNNNLTSGLPLNVKERGNGQDIGNQGNDHQDNDRNLGYGFEFLV